MIYEGGGRKKERDPPLSGRRIAAHCMQMRSDTPRYPASPPTVTFHFFHVDQRRYSPSSKGTRKCVHIDVEREKGWSRQDGRGKSQSERWFVTIRSLNEFGKRITDCSPLNTPANYQLSGVRKAPWRATDVAVHSLRTKHKLFILFRFHPIPSDPFRKFERRECWGESAFGIWARSDDWRIPDTKNLANARGRIGRFRGSLRWPQISSYDLEVSEFPPRLSDFEGRSR